MLTVDGVEGLIVSSRPSGRLLQGSTIALLGLSILLGAIIADPDLIPHHGPLPWLLPQIVLVFLIILIVRNSKKQRNRSQLMTDAFEAVQLQQWERARALFNQLLRSPIRYPTARAESLLGLAAVAESDHAYEASQRIYECLLQEKTADPIQLHTVRVAMAAAMLRTGQTADAVALIDRLSRMKLPGPLRAQVELLQLFREVTMGHGADAIECAEERRELFRQFLSTRAGYGYGLLAAAFDRANSPAQAQRCWHDATLLVPPTDLVKRFKELDPIRQRYVAAEIRL